MCVLRVTGKRFDADLHLAQSGLTAHKVFRAGEPRFQSSPEGKRNEVSGFTVDVSRRSWADLPGQVIDAIAFLKEHEHAIAKLRAAPGVDEIRLDFAIDLRIDRQKIMAQFDYFPPELVSLAGALGLGLEMSIYPPDLETLAKARASAGGSDADR
jgi:hypothetical protein